MADAITDLRNFTGDYVVTGASSKIASSLSGRILGGLLPKVLGLVPGFYFADTGNLPANEGAYGMPSVNALLTYVDLNKFPPEQQKLMREIAVLRDLSGAIENGKEIIPDTLDKFLNESEVKALSSGKTSILEGLTFARRHKLSQQAQDALFQAGRKPEPEKNFFEKPEEPKTDQKEEAVPGDPAVVSNLAALDSPFLKFLLETPQLRQMAATLIDDIINLCKEITILRDLLNAVAPGLVDNALPGVKEALLHAGAAPASSASDLPQVESPSMVPAVAHTGNRGQLKILQANLNFVPEKPELYASANINSLTFDPNNESWKKFAATLDHGEADDLLRKIEDQITGKRIEFSARERDILKSADFSQAIGPAVTAGGVAHGTPLGDYKFTGRKLDSAAIKQFLTFPSPIPE